MMGDAAPLKVVLLVDDDKVTNMMHTRLIKRSGLIDHVDIATDGIAALEYLKKRGFKKLGLPELIVLDINMPRMDGFEFLEEYADLSARDGTGKPMIIMLSTSVLRTDQERAEADPNVYQFLSKPIAQDDITNFVTMYQDFIKE